MAETLVIAIGGNAILKENQKGTVEEQFANVRACCGPIVDLYTRGYRIVLVHGNGPQVGNILLQVEAAVDTVAPQTIDLCGAQTQGQLGYMIQLSMHNAFRDCGVDGKNHQRGNAGGGGCRRPGVSEPHKTHWPILFGRTGKDDSEESAGGSASGGRRPGLPPGGAVAQAPEDH